MRYLQHIISNNINVTSPTEQLLEKNYYSILEKYDVNSESPKLVEELKSLFFPKKFLESLSINTNASLKNSSVAAKNETELKAEPQNLASQLNIDSSMLQNLLSGAAIKQSAQGESISENLVEKPVDLSSIQFLEVKANQRKALPSQRLSNKAFINHLKMKIQNDNPQKEFYDQERMLDQQLIQGITGKAPAR